jgi:signal transduction histidine kinase
MVSKMDAGPSPSRTDAAGARRDFLRRFFHDVATPLSAVSLHLEAADRRARRGGDPSGSLATARDELARAFELFERSRELLLEEPRSPEAFDWDELVGATAREIAGNDVPIEGRTGAALQGNARSLSEAVAALLRNAVEASQEADVKVFLERNGANVQVRVENPGRLPDEPQSLFSPRVARDGRRWGMGLARARLNAADAGGTVRLEQIGERVRATLEVPEETP